MRRRPHPRLGLCGGRECWCALPSPCLLLPWRWTSTYGLTSPCRLPAAGCPRPLGPAALFQAGWPQHCAGQWVTCHRFSEMFYTDSSQHVLTHLTWHTWRVPLRVQSLLDAVDPQSCVDSSKTWETGTRSMFLSTPEVFVWVHLWKWLTCCSAQFCSSIHKLWILHIWTFVHVAGWAVGLVLRSQCLHCLFRGQWEASLGHIVTQVSSPWDDASS